MRTGLIDRILGKIISRKFTVFVTATGLMLWSDLTSDTWGMIRVSGERSRDVLERICPIDLDPNVFTLGSVSRTVMEHIGTIIFRDGDESYVLLTMRSFSRSMLHAIEVSVKNVL